MRPPNQWRLIVDQPACGAWNMAVDRAIQLEHAASGSPATLRIYTWSNPTLSLGRFQGADNVDLDACANNGIGVVRRPTGGRAVFHCDEVTYAVVAGVRDGIPPGIKESYRHLAQALSAAFTNIGITVDPSRGVDAKRPRSNLSACYLHLQSADLSVDSRKLCGSAQVWYAKTVLQHGSFVRTRDCLREGVALGLADEEIARLAAEAISIEQLLGVTPDLEVISDSVVGAFGAVLGVEFTLGALSEREEALAGSLVAEFKVSDHP